MNGYKKRSRNLYDPQSKKPFKLSRSKIEDFMKCKRCFYIDRRLGFGKPSTPPWSLNSAVDALLKKEFDHYRVLGKPHPLLKANQVDAIPYQHKDLEDWRNAFKGVTYLDKRTQLLITGGIDDVWINPKEELLIADYKATAKTTEVNLNSPWQIGYKRQVEIYQWLFQKNGFKVNPTAYFVYCNGRLNNPRFYERLEFSVKLLPHKGDTRWVDKTLTEIKNCLDAKSPPKGSPDCEYCAYRSLIGKCLSGLSPSIKE